jgi:PKD repeat protein
MFSRRILRVSILAGGASAALLGMRSDAASTRAPAVAIEPFAAQTGRSGHSTAFATINLREIASQPQAARPAAESEEREPSRFLPKRPLPANAPLRIEAHRPRVEQIEAPRVSSPPLAASFEALPDNGTRFPPDTEGAVGPNHIMVTLNTETRIQDHSGNELLRVSFDNFWSKVSQGLSLTDPKTLYEPFVDRWIAMGLAGYNSKDSAILIGVSQTGDPTGNWNLYSVVADPSGSLFADYPSLGFNKDWIAVQVNMWTVADKLDDSQFQDSHILVFDKANLIAGGTDARHTLFPLSADLGTGQVPAATYDPTEPVLYVLEDWNGDSDGVGSLALFSITGPVGSEIFSTISFPATDATWDDAAPNDEDFAPQQGTTAKIANGGADFTHVSLRNGLITAAQTIFLPSGGSPTRSAAQWWQLTREGFVASRGRIDDASAQTFHAYPSAATNVRNDLIVGYSTFSSQQFASSGYAFRAASDASGTVRDGGLIKSGEASYVRTGGGTRNRWGDYSTCAFDPTNGVDLWTIQENAMKSSGLAGGAWDTWWGRIAPESEPTVAMPVASFTAPSTAVAGASVPFSDDSTGATQWFWSFGDGTTSTDRSPAHAFGFDGTFTVTQTVVNQTGAVSTTRTIMISPPSKAVPQPVPDTHSHPRVVSPHS